MTSVEGPLLDQASLCAPILEALPDWFAPLEELLTLWSEDDAALVLIKTLG